MWRELCVASPDARRILGCQHLLAKPERRPAIELLTPPLFSERSQRIYTS